MLTRAYFGVKADPLLEQRVFAMREDIFDIAYEPIGILYPTGFVRLSLKTETKTTKTP